MGAQLGPGDVSPQPPKDFYDFHTKNTHFSTLFYRKKRYRFLQESAVTTDNTEYKNKSVADALSESRNLIKINQRRLQPLLIGVIVHKRLDLAYYKFLERQSEGEGAWRGSPLRESMIVI